MSNEDLFRLISTKRNRKTPNLNEIKEYEVLELKGVRHFFSFGLSRTKRSWP